MRLRPVIKGALTFIPGFEHILPKAIASRNPPPEYYYGVWLKHIALLNANGFPGLPAKVAELGPGDSLGLGIAALLSGVDTYYGLDVVAHTKPEENLSTFDKLLERFKTRAPRPNKGWPDFDHLLDQRLFPSHILTDEILRKSLAPERLQHIRSALTNSSGRSGPIHITYRVPWNDAAVIERDSIDLIISQAVLEHVVDIAGTYAALNEWLKPGGVMSHQIDFRSHDLTAEWNGHRAISESMWRIMLGRRPYLLNREPASTHTREMRALGLKLVCDLNNYRKDGIPRSKLTARWQDITDEDLNCVESLVQASKPVIATKARAN